MPCAAVTPGCFNRELGCARLLSSVLALGPVVPRGPNFDSEGSTKVPLTACSVTAVKVMRNDITLLSSFMSTADSWYIIMVLLPSCEDYIYYNIDVRRARAAICTL